MPSGSNVVLVVDDYDDSRASMRDLLEDLGYEVVEAANGQEAFEFLIFNPTVKVGLVMLDLDMPVMDGGQFLSLVKSYSRLSKLPVVVVSAFVAKLPEQQRKTVSACVQTPFEVPKLQALVRSLASPHSTN